MDSSIDRLRAGLTRLAPKDREFAESLLNRADTRGLTAKEQPWIERLAERANSTDQADAPINVSPIVAMFDKAKATLKQPKILVDVDGTLMRLSVATERSRVPGSIFVTSADPASEVRDYYCRILRDGSMVFGRDVAGDVKRKIGAALVKFADDPTAAAKAFGKRTGRCCFCNLVLSDGPSIHAGYGPVCARRLALPWGACEAV